MRGWLSAGGFVKCGALVLEVSEFLECFCFWVKVGFEGAWLAVFFTFLSVLVESSRFEGPFPNGAFLFFCWEVIIIFVFLYDI